MLRILHVAPFVPGGTQQEVKQGSGGRLIEEGQGRGDKPWALNEAGCVGVGLTHAGIVSCDPFTRVATTTSTTLKGSVKGLLRLW
jgi:hypothetical protein